jgi:hypothetical protein
VTTAVTASNRANVLPPISVLDKPAPQVVSMSLASSLATMHPVDTGRAAPENSEEWVEFPFARQPAESIAIEAEGNQLRLPYIAGGGTSGEAAADYALLQKFTEYYRSGTEGNLTMFDLWRGHVLPNNTFNGDTTYHRTVCNVVAVSAIVKEQEPENPNIDWTRLADMLNAVMVDYALGSGKGWGYGGRQGGSPGLYWNTTSIGYPCAVATAILWKQSEFDQTKRNLAVYVLGDLAERVSKNRTNNYYSSKQSCADSWVEVAANDAAFLAAMSQFERSNPAADGWLHNATRIMQWAYDHQTIVECPAPNGEDFSNLIANHRMFPHPYYSLAILMETSRALMPWLAQGVVIQSNDTGIADIPALGPLSGNQDLYGGDIARPHRIFNSVNRYINLGGNLAFVGETYNVTDNFASSIAFLSRYYYGNPGVIDWGTGVEILHTAYVYPLFLDFTFYPSPGNGSAYYWRLLNYENSHPNRGYLPPPGPFPCSIRAIPESVWSPFATPPLWDTSFLPGTCAARGNAALVPYFDAFVPNRSEQVNTHFFLNSTKAFNHLVSYLIMKGHPGTNYWQPNGAASTLPLLEVANTGSLTPSQ